MSNFLTTTTTAAIADPVTKHHMEKMADATALALATTFKNSKAQKQQLQSLEKEDRAFGFRQQQEQLHRGTTTRANADPSSCSSSSASAPPPPSSESPFGKIHFQTKVSKNLFDETSLILNPQFLGNVAAQYQPRPPPPFVPVSSLVSSSSRSSSRKKKKNSENASTTATCASDADQQQQVTTNFFSSHPPPPPSSSNLLPSAISSSLPPLDVAAPARNLCIELLATRVVSCVKAVSLLLQEFSSSPGQSLPHVAVLGPGNVGHTVLSHLVKLLPADRIVILARDSKNEVCEQFSTKHGVRALSTNILRDERLVDVIKNYRNKIQEEALKKQRDAGLLCNIISSNNNNDKSSSSGEGGSRCATGTTVATFAPAASAAASSSVSSATTPSSSSSSHVAPEVAAAQNISVVLQQIHVLIVCCRPAQLSEVASSLQPWLRSSSVVVVSTLVGVTADRVAALFRVPSSLSVTVDTNEMLFDFESRSRLSTRAQENAVAAAKLLGNLNVRSNSIANNNNDNDDVDGGDRGENKSNNINNQFSPPSSVVGALVNMKRAEAALSSPTSFKKSATRDEAEQMRALTLLETQRAVAHHQQNQLRFFTREPLDFVHRFFFALVSTLLERCGVGPAEAWLGVAKLLLLPGGGGAGVGSGGQNNNNNNNILNSTGSGNRKQSATTSSFTTLRSSSSIQVPKGIGAQGPGLVSKCSVQTLAQAVGLSVGEVMRIIDEKMVQFAMSAK